MKYLLGLVVALVVMVPCQSQAWQSKEELAAEYVDLVITDDPSWVWRRIAPIIAAQDVKSDDHEAAKRMADAERLFQGMDWSIVRSSLVEWMVSNLSWGQLNKIVEAQRVLGDDKELFFKTYQLGEATQKIMFDEVVRTAERLDIK